MMTLTTVSEQLSSTQSRVFWRVGTQRKGILNITLDFENDDSALLCELCAIRHLLIESQVFGRVPGTGKGYKLVVSKVQLKSWHEEDPTRSTPKSLPPSCNLAWLEC